ncbi:MAG TPA: nuclear transport factor 2 family protein [Polyangiaceae bacterium]|nr:nuclear transport factor 2 family protein [Polyangiaceae bacterium]
MTAKTIEKKVVELENQYWQALKENDVATVTRLTDDPCIVTGAQGVGRLDRKAFLAMMNSPQAYKLNAFKVNDFQVRALGDDVAIVAYRVHEELTVDGKEVQFDAADSSTWIRRDGEWVCALHTEAIAGDPFGRDRPRAS